MNTTEKNAHLRDASLAYFGVSILTAVVLDTLRMKMEPLYGKLCCVVVELPILLAVFWNASLWSRKHFHIPSKLSLHLVMSLTAFGLFFLVEMLLSMFALDMTLQEALADYPASFLDKFPANLIGRIGEIVYGLIPILQVLTEQTNDVPVRRKVKP